MSDSPENLQESTLSGDEPSMEDILASIRRIISEDEPVAMESPEDVVVDLKSDAEIETLEAEDDILSALGSPLEPSEDIVEAQADVVDLDLDEVLADMDAVVEPQVEAMGSMLTADTSGADDDILALLDMDIPLEPDTVETAIDPEPSAMVPAPESVTASDDDMDALLDDILLAPEDEVELAELPEQATVENDPDLEKVKALMADLADDGGEAVETEDDLDALLAIPEIEEEVEIEAPALEVEAVAEVQTEPESEAVEMAEADTAEEEEDILGDILNMTLEDEIKTHPEELDALTAADVALDEQANIEANEVAEQIETAESADDLPSLADIAAAAEADAVEAETAAVAPNPIAATAGLAAMGAGAVALGATALGEETADDEIATSEPSDIEVTVNTVDAQTPESQTPEPMSPEEPPMPVQAVNTDAILDDVTESAAAGAFAELNQVVEEKAVFNERGPRIGDLVQEALRPMLKEWLDANLKGIVERAVAKEVKRISSGK